jgi:hypothetical protein
MRRHAFVVGLLHRAPKTLAYLQHCFTPTRLNNIFGRPVMSSFAVGIRANGRNPTGTEDGARGNALLRLVHGRRLRRFI